MNDLPKETAFQPAPYIALVGLDAATNGVHTAIWNAFAINRAADRPQLYYKLLPADYVFPVAKAKKSYERYIPSGIIKTGWLAKHLFEIPSVAVVFEEVPSWEALAAPKSESRVRVIERINHVRNSLAGRQTRIVLVLLLQQTNPVAPLMEDFAKNEIAARLCTDCDLHAKSLYTISMDEVHLIPGLVQRMEQVIFDLAKGYYLAQAKSVKAHKDQLNKSSQLYLYIRHEFKLAFFNEIRLINNTALGHYKTAYASLMEIRPSPLNLFEVKSIASLLNYKICRLAFYLNIPMDAISHFRKHVEIFQNRPPPPTASSIEFEHHGWLSDQFLVFAELFEVAISTFNLAPSSSQHPGVYFFDASTHMLERRRAATGAINREELMRSVSQEEAALLGEIVDCQAREFIGQFSFKHDLPETDRIKLAYRALQYRELSVDHTALLISLYVHVLNQIRKFKKPRFTRYLMYLIGREYHGSGRHEDALTYFNNILPFYREERWAEIYFEIVQLALVSSYLVADLPTFVRLAFEQMAGDSRVAGNVEARSDLMATTLAMLSHRWRPLSIGSFRSPDPILEAKWAEVIAQRSSPTAPPLPDISIAMDARAVDYLSAKVAFNAPTYYIGARVTVAVALYSSLPLDLERRFSLQLRFSLPYYDQFAMLSGEEETVIRRLEANTMAQFAFDFAPLLEDVGKELRVTGLTLQSLNDSEDQRQQNISFHWTFAGNVRATVGSGDDDQLSSICGAVNERRAPFAKFQPLLKTTILEHSSKLEVEAVAPPSTVYLDEHFPLRFRLVSGEDFPISKLKLSVKLLTAEEPQQQQVALEPFYFNVFSLEGGKLTPVDPEKQLVPLIEDLEPGGTVHSIIVFKVVAGAETKLGPGGGCMLNCTFTYDLLLEGEKRKNQMQFVAAQKTLLLPLTALAPFSLRFSVANLGTESVGIPETTTTSTIRVAEPFRLSIEVGQTPTKTTKVKLSGDQQKLSEEEKDEIEVDSLTPLLAPSTSFVGEATATKFPLSLSACPLRQTYELVAGAESPVATSLGACTVQWRRAKKTKQEQNGTSLEVLPANESTFSLPATVVSSSIVFVELLLPPVDSVHSRAAFTARYRIHNRLDVDLTAEISMGTSDCFMVSGNKLIKVCIPAKLFIEQTYIFLPLLCGQLALPQLGVTVHLPGAQAPVALDHINQMMPPSMKVLPQIRAV